MPSEPDDEPGTEPGDDDVVARARDLADDALFPTAQEVDRAARVPRRRLGALGAAGLFGIAGPPTHGGLDLGPYETRRVVAAVGGGCGATFFVWVQHHGVVRTVRSSPNRALVGRVLAGMCSGELIAGVAFAHVRRSGPPAVRATRVADGWRLDGRAPWATSWGLADWFAVAAVADSGELVWSMVAGERPSGVTATPLALPVLAATGTVELAFDGCVVPDEQVADIEDLDAWRRADRRRASIGQPAVLGVADRAVRLLAGTADLHDRAARRALDRLDGELRAAWERDDRLVEALAAGEDVVAEASDHRAACLDLGRRATTALLAGVGGRGMDLAHPAQRLAREADFYVVQAQTADGRAATLRSV